eukprot:PhF_6_TR41331/c0_g1_i2/m.62663
MQHSTRPNSVRLLQQTSHPHCGCPADATLSSFASPEFPWRIQSHKTRIVHHPPWVGIRFISLRRVIHPKHFAQGMIVTSSRCPRRISLNAVLRSMLSIMKLFTVMRKW